MNQSKYLKQITNAINNLAINVGTVDMSGILANETDMNGHLSNIEDGILTLDGCINSGNKLKVNLCELNDAGISRNSGDLEDGTPRMCIASNDVNISAVKSNTDNMSTVLTNLNACLDTFRNKVTVDLSKINTNTISVDAGVNDAGVIRVAVADNDTNLSLINTYINALNTLVQAWNSGYVPAVNVNLRGIQYGAGANPISVGAGASDNATIRMTIANDDTNLSAMKTKIDSIYTILN